MNAVHLTAYGNPAWSLVTADVSDSPSAGEFGGEDPATRRNPLGLIGWLTKPHD